MPNISIIQGILQVLNNTGHKNRESIVSLAFSNKKSNKLNAKIYNLSYFLVVK
jgi:hypothetical protein